MKSTTFALVAAAIPFAFAAPFEKREAQKYQVDWVTDVEIVTAYAEVTEYWTGQPAVQTAYVTATAEAPATTEAAHKQHGGHHWTYTAPAAPPATTEAPAPPSVEITTVLPAPSTEAPVVETTPEVPSFTAPAVETTTSETPSAASPATGATTGVGPYDIDAGSTTITASVGAKTGAPGYDLGDGAMQAALLNSTNYWRAEFQAAPLTWNYTLQAMAQDTANQCLFEHTNAGQNLAAGYGGPESANDGWAGEYTQYNFADPDFSESAGHFTQVVWQDTTTLGCAAVNCGSGHPAQGWYLVCNYFPVGNMLGEFAQQVKPKASY